MVNEFIKGVIKLHQLIKNIFSKTKSADIRDHTIPYTETFYFFNIPTIVVTKKNTSDIAETNYSLFFFNFRKKISYDKNGFYQKNKMSLTFFEIQLFSRTTNKFEFEHFYNSLTSGMIRIINTSNLHKKTFSKYKNIHKGQNLVLVGAGPTVNNYNPIQHAVHVGCNRAFLLDKIKFEYLFSCDKIGIESFYKELSDYAGNECVKFVGDLNCGTDYQISESYALKLNAVRYKTTNGITQHRFALDIESEPLGAFHSVSLQAIQFMLYTNPKKIYLVGIDCSSQGKHFAGLEHDVSTRGEKIDKLQKIQINEWCKLKEFALNYYPDTEIISINPVGLKGLFKDIYSEKQGETI